MKKHAFYAELAYILGLLLLAAGTAMMEKANFGLSMVIAPAYLVHLKLNPLSPFFTFGTTGYLVELMLLIVLACIRRRVHPGYLFSFITAFIYGMLLDGAISVIGRIGGNSMALRLVFYFAGMALCAAGVSMLFNTYIAPEAYDLFVKEIAPMLGLPVHRFKTIYDVCSCALAVILSFAFFGFGVFEGVGLGTLVCALVNGSLIGAFGRLWEKHFVFRDALPLRRLFEGK